MKHRIRSERHAPLSARLLLAAPVLVAGAGVALAGRLIGGGAGAATTLLAMLVTGTVAVLCWRTALVIQTGELLVRNPLRSRRLSPAQVVELRPERVAGLLGRLGTEVGVIRPGGAVVRVAATLEVAGVGRGSSRAALFLALRRWAATHDVPDRLPRHEFAAPETRHDLLTGGEVVEVRGRMRRTDARGWGDWGPGVIVLPAVGSGQRSQWQSDEVSGSVAKSKPVALDVQDKVVERGVRFPEEAFFGKTTGFIVITSVRRTVELAFPEGEAALVLARLRQLEREPGSADATTPRPS